MQPFARAVAIVALLLVAGCASNDADDATTTTDNDAARSFIAVEAPIATDASGAEPSLGVTLDGVLYTDLSS